MTVLGLRKYLASKEEPEVELIEGDDSEPLEAEEEITEGDDSESVEAEEECLYIKWAYTLMLGRH